MAVKGDKFKPEGTLKKFLEVGKKQSRVLTTVERHLITKPAPNDRRSDVLHPSAMVKDDWCHRSSYFQLLGFPPPPSKYRVTLSQKRVFQTGHDIHAGWQSIFQEMGTLYGIYECYKCGLKEWGMADAKCPICDTTNFLYREVSLQYDLLRISGHADGILLGFGEPLMLEIKSLGAGTFRFESPQLFAEHNGDLDAMWKAFDAPFMSHIKQAQMYMKLAELIGLQHQPQEALFLYENKSNQTHKEFVVAKSDFGISHLLEEAAQIVAAVDKREALTCNIDPNAGCYQCKGYADVQA
jgi:hypothetical protein